MVNHYFMHASTSQHVATGGSVYMIAIHHRCDGRYAIKRKELLLVSAGILPINISFVVCPFLSTSISQKGDDVYSCSSLQRYTLFPFVPNF